jgi:putative spermidine/putrescine transport system permease protein
MPSKGSTRTGIGAGWGLTAAAAGGLLFLHLPLAFIFLYAFSTDEKSFSFPLPGLTTKWFGVVLDRPDIWAAMWLSVKVAAVATAVAMVLGTLAAAAMYRQKFFGREVVTLLILLPIALPGMSRHQPALGLQSGGSAVQLFHRPGPCHLLHRRGL